MSDCFAISPWTALIPDARSPVGRRRWRWHWQQRVLLWKPVFAFMEGIFVEALRSGAWLLLAKINLGNAETPQRLVGLL